MTNENIKRRSNSKADVYEKEEEKGGRERGGGGVISERGRRVKREER